ncbi:unnamed protein product [Amoebophrya sp. A120]|nr:unnamed protein product [Amoebophrya sp. A120]|eukprot:GSA120T00007702001.1
MQAPPIMMQPPPMMQPPVMSLSLPASITSPNAMPQLPPASTPPPVNLMQMQAPKPLQVQIQTPASMVSGVNSLLNGPPGGNISGAASAVGGASFLSGAPPVPRNHFAGMDTRQKRPSTPSSALNQFSMAPPPGNSTSAGMSSGGQPVPIATAAATQQPRKVLKNLAYHLRDQARIIQLNHPESLDQYKSLGILFDLVDLCDQAAAVSDSRFAKDELQTLFWRAVDLLKQCPVDGLSPFRSYGLRLEHTIQAMWAAYAQRPPVKDVPAAFEVPEIRLLPVGSQVEYYSNTYRRWMEATVLGHLPEGDYQLDIQAHARKENVRAVITRSREHAQSSSDLPQPPRTQQQGLSNDLNGAAALVAAAGGEIASTPTGEQGATYPPGTIVEYWSTSLNQWILAEVLKYNLHNKTYQLDCKNNAPRDRIRPHARSPRDVRPLTEHTRPVLQKCNDHDGASSQVSSAAGGGPLASSKENHYSNKSRSQSRGASKDLAGSRQFAGSPPMSLQEAPTPGTKETREKELSAMEPPEDPEAKLVVKTHHDMKTGKIVQTEIDPEGGQTKFIYDYSDTANASAKPAMRRSAVMREQTADFIRNSGKHRGPPQLTVHVMTNPADQAGGNYATNFPPTGSSDPAAHQHAMNSRYMSKVDKLKQQSEDTRNYTMKKVDQLTRKAQQLVERFENDEMNLDLKQYDIPKLSTIQPHGGNIPGFGPQGDINMRASSNMRQSSGAAAGMNSVRMSQNPYMQEYFETRTEEGDNLEGDNGTAAGSPPPGVGQHRGGGGGEDRHYQKMMNNTPVITSSSSSARAGAGNNQGNYNKPSNVVATKQPRKMSAYPDSESSEADEKSSSFHSRSNNNNSRTNNKVNTSFASNSTRNANLSRMLDSGRKPKPVKLVNYGAADSDSDSDNMTAVNSVLNRRKYQPWKLRSSPLYDEEDRGSTELSFGANKRSGGRPKKKCETASVRKRTSDSDEMFSDADDSLAVGTRGQTAWDFVSIPSKNTDAGESSSSPDKNKAPNENGKMMKNANKEKEQQAIDVKSEKGGASSGGEVEEETSPARRGSTSTTAGNKLRTQNQKKKANFATRNNNRSAHALGGGRKALDDSDSSPPSRVMKKTSAPAAASGTFVNRKKNSSYKRRDSSEQASPAKGPGRRDSDTSEPAKWTPWGGHFGLGRFGRIDDEDDDE